MVLSFYSKKEVREKKLPIDHNIILAVLSHRPSWKKVAIVRHGTQVWRNGKGEELLLPVDNTLGDYYSLCFQAGITLGIIESVWVYKHIKGA